MAVLCGINAHNTVFGSKRSAICASVEMSYNVFFKLNDLHISTSVYATWKKVPIRRQKNSGIIANTVSNVIAVLLTYELPTILVQPMTQFPVILLNGLSFPFPNDAIRRRPFRSSALCGIASSIRSTSQRIWEGRWGRFLVRSVKAREMTLNWFQR